MPFRANRATVIGQISGQLEALAARVHAELANGDQLVYADDDGKIFAQDPEQATNIPPHWIAGTFRLGQPFEALVEDLEYLRDSRKKDWILD